MNMSRRLQLMDYRVPKKIEGRTFAPMMILPNDFSNYCVVFTVVVVST